MAGLLDGKVALVTGASSGIGEATALALAEQGAKVAVAARREERLEELVRRIEEKGAEAMPIIADVSEEGQAHDMVRTAFGRWQRLDILVNDAGVMLLGPIDEQDSEDWRRMVNINLLGLMYTTQVALSIMEEQQSGHIVNVSSVAGRTAHAGSGGYNATKWGVVAFSEALRQEVYSKHIRVTVIEPGVVATELQQHITFEAARKETQQWVQSMTPLQSEDIAAAIVYAVTQPERVNVNEILIRPTEQAR